MLDPNSFKNQNHEVELKDPNNIPINVVLIGIIIVGIVGFIYYFYIKKKIEKDASND